MKLDLLFKLAGVSFYVIVIKQNAKSDVLKIHISGHRWTSF